MSLQQKLLMVIILAAGIPYWGQAQDGRQPKYVKLLGQKVFKEGVQLLIKTLHKALTEQGVVIVK